MTAVILKTAKSSITYKDYWVYKLYELRHLMDDTHRRVNNKTLNKDIYFDYLCQHSSLWHGLF